MILRRCESLLGTLDPPMAAASARVLLALVLARVAALNCCQPLFSANRCYLMLALELAAAAVIQLALETAS